MSAGNRCVYYDDETRKMYTVSTDFGTLLCVNAMGTATSTELTYPGGIGKVSHVTPLQQQMVDGGFLFEGFIIERKHYVAAPSKPEELRAYKHLWRRSWSDDMELSPMQRAAPAIEWTPWA